MNNFDVTQETRHDIIDRKAKLNELWNQFDDVQSRIEILENEEPSIDDKEALLAQQAQQRTAFEESYFNLLSRYNVILELYNIRHRTA